MIWRVPDTPGLAAVGAVVADAAVGVLVAAAVVADVDAAAGSLTLVDEDVGSGFAASSFDGSVTAQPAMIRMNISAAAIVGGLAILIRDKFNNLVIFASSLYVRHVGFFAKPTVANFENDGVAFVRHLGQVLWETQRLVRVLVATPAVVAHPLPAVRHLDPA